MALLALNDIHVNYGLSRIIHGVSLAMERGELISLVGRNGVGKSTTMRSIMGLTPCRAGSIMWKGNDIARLRPHQIARLGIGYVPEDRRIFSGLTVWENLDVARLPRRAESPYWDEARIFALFPDLERFRDRKGGLLSGGQQQMLAIARTLMGNPELLLLDEPSEGLAPLIVETLEATIRELKAEGLSIVLAEQNLQFVLSLSDRCVLLEKGAVMYAGSADQLRADRDVQARYLQI
jgi:branched-chain amino acid transport system ATP-binding protein